MEIESRLKRSLESNSKLTKILFDPTVQVTRSVPRMSLMTLFSNIGGCVGLTLGYSLLQLGEKIQMALQYCRRFIRSCMGWKISLNWSLWIFSCKESVVYLFLFTFQWSCMIVRRFDFCWFGGNLKHFVDAASNVCLNFLLLIIASEK